MSSEPPKEPNPSQPPEAEDAEPNAASKDLADGLTLMLSAAKKALKSMDPARIEEVGRRAIRTLENVDAKKVGAMGVKAARKMDPRKIEEVAEEAGRELLSVVERVADRMERIASGAIQGAKDGSRGDERRASTPPPTATPETKPSARAEGEGKSDEPEKSDGDDEGKPRVRIGD
jgi:hypothetical protein